MLTVLVMFTGCATQTSPNRAVTMSTAGRVSDEYAEHRDLYGLSVHGNWCGIGSTGGPVIDELDAICREHDLCIAREGVFNCGCDLDMMYGIGTTRWSQALRPKAHQIFEAIAALPCQSVGDKTWRKKIELAEGVRQTEVREGKQRPLAGVNRFLDLMRVMFSSDKTS